MDTRAAKELIHISGWLDRVDEIVARGKTAYLSDDLLQEAGDSLMMKLGEAANRLARMEVIGPDGVDWVVAVAHPRQGSAHLEGVAGTTGLCSAFSARGEFMVVTGGGPACTTKQSTCTLTLGKSTSEGHHAYARPRNHQLFRLRCLASHGSIHRKCAMILNMR